MASKNRAIFLDRDGTIIKGVPYLRDIGQIVLNKNAAEGIKRFNELGYLVIIITNQSGVARGYFDEKRLREINEYLTDSLCALGARIDAVYYCPHMPDDMTPDGKRPCQCRKPRPKMLLDAAKTFDIMLEESIMVGDTPGDIMAGKNAGCKTALIDKGADYYDYKRDGSTGRPDYVVNDLLDVAALLKV